MRRSTAMCYAASLMLSLISLIAVSGAFGREPSTDDVRRISKEDLRALLDDPNTIIIDVRQDWQQSETKIKGAVQEDPMEEAGSWAGKYQKDKNIVLYCS